MHPLWLLLTVIHTVTALSATETLVLLDLVEYFQSEYLELLEESLQLRQTNYVSNASFPARKMVLTTVLSPQQLADGLGRKRPGRGGLPMVAAHSDGPAWSTFTQVRLNRTANHNFQTDKLLVYYKMGPRCEKKKKNLAPGKFQCTHLI